MTFAQYEAAQPAGDDQIAYTASQDATGRARLESVLDGYDTSGGRAGGGGSSDRAGRVESDMGSVPRDYDVDDFDNEEDREKIVLSGACVIVIVIHPLYHHRV